MPTIQSGIDGNVPLFAGHYVYAVKDNQTSYAIANEEGTPYLAQISLTKIQNSILI